jgi:hypothetical protein
LARDTTDVPGLQEETIWAREAVVAMEAIHPRVVHAAVAYAQEAAVAREKAGASIKEAESRATLIVRETR